jgi:hypothetical protein
MSWLNALFVLIICIVLAFCIMAWVSKEGAGKIGGHRSKSEDAVVAALEHITGLRFPQGKPKWLRECGKQLELDGWNEEAKIAFEYSGPLHYRWDPKVESRERFLQRIGRDAYKKALCKQMGVALIVVDAQLPRDRIYEYLQSRLADISEERRDGKYTRPTNYLPLREAAIVT